MTSRQNQCHEQLLRIGGKRLSAEELEIEVNRRKRRREEAPATPPPDPKPHSKEHFSKWFVESWTDESFSEELRGLLQKEHDGQLSLADKAELKRLINEEYNAFCESDGGASDATKVLGYESDGTLEP